MNNNIETIKIALLTLMLTIPAEVAFVLLADKNINANDYYTYGLAMASFYLIPIVLATGSLLL